MATRNTQPTHVPINECTEFTIYVKRRDVLDFTEGRLRILLKEEHDQAMKLSLNVLYEDYVAGKVAVAFSKGKAVYIKVTKNE